VWVENRAPFVGKIKMKKVLITGITGFAGSFLAENLVSQGLDVSGTYLNEESLQNIAPIKDKLKLGKIDLGDAPAIKNFILENTPDMIFHLAALASAAQSFENPAQFINNNVDAQINLLEAVRIGKISPKVLIVSSAEVYGDVNQKDLPIDETTELRPVNPYAVSKVAQDVLGLQYFLSYKIPIVRVRPFNHIGPRQSPSFVVASFAKKIAEIEKGVSEPVMKVGNLEAKRDFTDVRDIGEGYKLLLEKGEPGEVYNIGYGKSYMIQDILNRLLSLSKKEIKVEKDQSLMRPVDVPELVCDNTKVKKTTGWEAKIPIDETLKETLEYWRSLV